MNSSREWGKEELWGCDFRLYTYKSSLSSSSKHANSTDSLWHSGHSSLSAITFGNSSRVSKCPHEVTVDKCKFFAVRPTLVCPWVGVHKRTSLMSMSVHLTWRIREMRRQWSYSCCFVWCCFQDLFKIARSIHVKFSSSFFFKRFVRVQVVQLYNSYSLEEFRFHLSERSDSTCFFF